MLQVVSKSKIKRPSAIAYGNGLRAKVIRGPKQEGSEVKWYWSVEVYSNKKTTMLHSGWYSEFDIGTVAKRFVGHSEPVEKAKAHSIEELIERFSDSYQRSDLAENSKKICSINLNNLKRLLGSIRVDTVSLNDLETYQAARLGEGVCSETVAMEVRRLGQVFSWGAEQAPPLVQKALPKLKFKKAKLRAVKYTPTNEDVERFLGAIKGWRNLVVFLLYNTGCRIGEIASLTPADIDRANSLLRIKGKTGYRPVPVSQEVLDRLEGWNGWEVKAKYLCDEVFRYDAKRIFRELNIKPFTAHSLRRLYISNMIDAGIDDSTTASICGHDVVTLHRHYRRVTTGGQRSAVERLNSFRKG